MDDRRFNAAGASDFLLERFGLSAKPKTLANWRSAGSGPRYARLANGRTVYRESDLVAFAEGQIGPTVRNTRQERTAGADLPPGGPNARVGSAT
jgi:hypothetical protein